MPRTITIVGASARAAAFSAARAGYAVRAADLFGDADLQRICEVTQVDDYPTGLARVLDRLAAGGWMYTGALENHPELVGRMARLRPLWGNGEETLRRVRDPWQLDQALAERGLPRPAIERDAVRDGSWLRKPLASAGGLGIERHTLTSRNGSDPREVYFQQFVSGANCSALYLTARGEAVLLGITRQLIGARWTGASGFRYCGSIGPIAANAVVRQGFRAIGSALAQAFDLVGLFGVDAVVNRQAVWPVEVNPRYTASAEVLERALVFSAVERHVEACENGKLIGPIEPRDPGLFAKAIVFATESLNISEAIAERLLAMSAEPAWEATGGMTWPALADLPRAGARFDPGWPILTVFAHGANARETLHALKQQTARVRQIVAGG